MITALDHVNLRTTDADALAAWYEDILGLTPGPRPDFGVPGVWLYIGDTAVVHLIETKAALTRNETSLEHFAFRATGLTGFTDKLTACGIPFEFRKVPGTRITQVNLEDPSGTHLHVDFDGED
ncbi:VOC family protein [Roseobacter sp.]|uniref:VOC family protein n=1 Tax=Roseobacter sp. TaxID=1907202 RepID=UPI0025E81470|nr:VOC family protein [Roseobacter sp.]